MLYDCYIPFKIAGTNLWDFALTARRTDYIGPVPEACSPGLCISTDKAGQPIRVEAIFIINSCCPGIKDCIS